MSDFPAPNPTDDHWFYSSWRPAMAYQYLAVCIFDFILAPVLVGVYSAMFNEYHVWAPITLQAAGIYHVAMGAIVGVTSWSRGQERICALNNNDTSAVAPVDAPVDPPK